MDDIDILARVEGLFRHHWDPSVLAILGQRSYRFRALHTQLVTRAKVIHLDDNTLTRSLDRLQEVGAIRASTVTVGKREYPTYSLTRAGQARLDFYRAVTLAYRRSRSSSPRPCDGCCLHGPTRDGRVA